MTARARGPVTYICGGDYTRLRDRDPCPSAVHNWPLPAGYVDATVLFTPAETGDAE